MSKKIFDWALKQNELTPSSDYGPIWGRNTQTFTEDYKRCEGDALAMLLSMIQSRRDYTVYDGVGTRASVCDHYLRYLKQVRFDLSSIVPKSEEISFIPDTLKVVTEYGNVSSDYLRKLCYLDIIDRHYQVTDAPVFMEIGAGIGSLARVISSHYTNATYIICDLPESLFYSYTYLSHVFPEKVLLVDETNLESVFEAKWSERRFLLIPSRLRACIPAINIDVLINTASLGEMTNETCFSWFDFINKRKINNLFLLNRYLNNWHKSHKCGNFSSLLLDGSWDVLEWEIDPAFLKSPSEEMEPNYLMIYAQKSEAPVGIEAIETAEQSLEKAERSFFVQRHLKYPDNMKGKYHRSLYQGIDGPFYHYWQAIRLASGSRAIVEYLRFLRAWGPNDKMFEEIYSYSSLLFLRSSGSLTPLRGVENLWLYGAGEYGRWMLDLLQRVDIHVTGIFDSTKRGEWNNLFVSGLDEVQEKVGSSDMILVTSDHWHEIASIISKKVVDVQIVTYGNFSEFLEEPEIMYLT